MKAPAIILDFAPPRARTTVWSVISLLVGVSALAIVLWQYQLESQRRAGLEMRLAAAQHALARDPAAAARILRLNEQGAAVARELVAPWTRMLADLEVISRDSSGKIAVLAIEPDLEKHRVRISGESRDLQTTLEYLQRLQTTHSLRHPMLDSHEVVADNNEHPVRFALTADWREQP